MQERREFENATPEVQDQLNMIGELAGHYNQASGGESTEGSTTPTLWILARSLKESGFKLVPETDTKDGISEQCFQYGIGRGLIPQD